jgi:hypothetical protein
MTRNVTVLTPGLFAVGRPLKIASDLFIDGFVSEVSSAFGLKSLRKIIFFYLG